MSSLSVNSVSSGNLYVSTTIAQEKVESDRADVTETETQLNQDKALLDQDLTYLNSLQHKSVNVQRLEGSQIQTNALDRLAKSAQIAKLATQQALSPLVPYTPVTPVTPVAPITPVVTPSVTTSIAPSITPFIMPATSPTVGTRVNVFA